MNTLEEKIQKVAELSCKMSRLQRLVNMMNDPNKVLLEIQQVVDGAGMTPETHRLKPDMVEDLKASFMEKIETTWEELKVIVNAEEEPSVE